MENKNSFFIFIVSLFVALIAVNLYKKPSKKMDWAPTKAMVINPKAERYILKASNAANRALEDHSTARGLSLIKDRHQRDLKIQDEVFSKNIEWHKKVGIEPFTKYVCRVNRNIRQLKRAKRKLRRFSDDECVHAIDKNLNAEMNQLKALHDSVTQHDRYAKELQTRAIRDEIAFQASMISLSLL